MKQARILMLAAWFSITPLAWAQDASEEADPAAPPPIPEKVPGEEVEPSVVISEREGLAPVALNPWLEPSTCPTPEATSSAA